MSKKRTSAESNDDEQTNDSSQERDNAKRAKLASLSDTTLQDLPIELLQPILVIAVAMEVKSMKLKSSLEEAGMGLVMSRLGTVCSQWSSILTTDDFGNEVKRILQNSAQKLFSSITFKYAKKRTSDASINHVQTSEGSKSQKEDSAGRAKLDLLSDTTLQDLPIELLERILLKAVAMEVKDMKLVKSVWKETADRVICQLTTVCSQWSSILTTNIFRKKLHRTLDLTAEETIRLQFIGESPVQLGSAFFTVMKTDIYEIRREANAKFVMLVYDRDNTAHSKLVIPLTGLHPIAIGGCAKTESLYIINKDPENRSLLKVKKAGYGQFKIVPWVTDLPYSFTSVSVSALGNVVLVANERNGSQIICIFDESGHVTHELKSSNNSGEIQYISSVIQRRSTSLVLMYINNNKESNLVEVDLDGYCIQRCHNRFTRGATANFADQHERVVVSEEDNEFVVLDGELNVIQFTGPPLPGNQHQAPLRLHFCSEGSELLTSTIVARRWLHPVMLRFRFL